MDDAMASRHSPHDLSLIGIGLYTPADAQRLIGVPASRLTRWLTGHRIGARRFDRLWRSQVEIEGGQAVFGFRDLVQARVAAALIEHGFSAQKVRAAIKLASELLDTSHPFATARFKTDGKSLLLETLSEGEDDRLIDLFRGGQYVMRRVIQPSLKGIEFDDGLASLWWPLGRSAGIVLDPGRQFGRPIDAETGVPTEILTRAVEAEGSVEEAARSYFVSQAAIRRAVAFEQSRAA